LRCYRQLGADSGLSGDEHSELRWLTPAAASVLPDLALEEYRTLSDDLIDDQAR
jgi:hypothetical protein